MHSLEVQSTLLLQYICIDVVAISYQVPAGSTVIPEIFQSWAHACMHAAPKNRPRGGSHQLAAEGPLDDASNGGDGKHFTVWLLEANRRPWLPWRGTCWRSPCRYAVTMWSSEAVVHMQINEAR